LVKKSPNDSPLVILENFNIDILKEINHKNNKKISNRFYEYIQIKIPIKKQHNKNWIIVRPHMDKYI